MLAGNKVEGSDRTGTFRGKDGDKKARFRKQRGTGGDGREEEEKYESGMERGREEEGWRIGR